MIPNEVIAAAVSFVSIPSTDYATTTPFVKTDELVSLNMSSMQLNTIRARGTFTVLMP